MRTVERKLVCSLGFWEQSVTRWPILKSDTSLRNLYALVMFGLWFEHETNREILPSEYIAQAEGKSSDGYSAQAIIDRFSTEIFKVVLSGWEYTKGKARTIQEKHIPADFQSIYAKELKTPRKDKAVDLFSLKVVTQKTVRETKDSYLAEVRLQAARGHHVAQKVIDYLNNVPVHTFNDLITRNLDRAADAAETLTSKDYNKRLLLQIANLNLQPVYGPTPHSTRIFPVNSSAVQLTRSVRHALFHGCVEVDICHAQLTIAAHVWDVSPLKAYLAVVKDVWADLVKQIPGATEGQVKDHVKTFIYAILYGADEKKAKWILNKALTKEGFKTHGLYQYAPIVALLDIRAKIQASIQAKGHAIDAFGQPVNVTKDQSVRSVMAQIAQSYEMWMMSRVVDVTDDRFKIVLWLHDSVVLWIGRDRDREAVTKQVGDAIISAALEKGIAVKLGVKEL